MVTLYHQVDFMNGLSERTTGTLLKALLGQRLLASDTPQGRVRFGLPLHALRHYMPALWPEAEADRPDAALTTRIKGHQPSPTFLADMTALITGTLSAEAVRLRVIDRAWRTNRWA